ncbi:hypothetical protein PG994_001876 [Apiospora phragmitis]|uniref:Uncharacterized protein n=1 Tax=Apiospora phragmitis TaxID=2905665 RepID=A0ABR1WUS0_9PEZI
MQLKRVPGPPKAQGWEWDEKMKAASTRPLPAPFVQAIDSQIIHLPTTSLGSTTMRMGWRALGWFAIHARPKWWYLMWYSILPFSTRLALPSTANPQFDAPTFLQYIDDSGPSSSGSVIASACATPTSTSWITAFLVTVAQSKSPAIRGSNDGTTTRGG